MPPKYPTTPMCDGQFLELFEDSVQDSDVFIATAAKCGQTWLQTLLFHLKTRGAAPNFHGRDLLDVSPWLELPGDSTIRRAPVDRAGLLADLNNLDAPRLFKMHVVWEEIPRPLGSKSKVMTITRDPRDVPYSMYSHLQALKHHPDPPADFDSYFEQWMDFGFYFKFVKGFWPHKSDADVLWLRYEDLQSDLRQQTNRILDFLGWEITPDEIDRVLPLVQLSHMKASEKKSPRRVDLWKEGESFFREGGVGKNRTRLSPSQEDRIMRRARDEFETECFEFVTSLPDSRDEHPG